MTESHFGTTYSSVIKDESVAYTIGNNALEYGYAENNKFNFTGYLKYFFKACGDVIFG